MYIFSKAVIILAPSGGGKDAVMSRLEKLGIACPCRRDTTRVSRPIDNGSYRFISESEFFSQMALGNYFLSHRFAGHWYGVPVAEVERIWSANLPALLKGGITEVPVAKDRLKILRPESKVIVIHLLPEPRDAWIQVLHERGLTDIPERVRESEEAMHQAMGEYRHVVDYFVTNRFGDFDETIRQVVSII